MEPLVTWTRVYYNRVVHEFPELQLSSFVHFAIVVVETQSIVGFRHLAHIGNL